MVSKTELDAEHGSAEIQIIESGAIVDVPLKVTVTCNNVNFTGPVADSRPGLPGPVAVSEANICIEGEIPLFIKVNYRLGTNDAVQGI